MWVVLLLCVVALACVFFFYILLFVWWFELCVFVVICFAAFLMFWVFGGCIYGCFVEKSGIIYLFFEKKVENVL